MVIIPDDITSQRYRRFVFPSKVFCFFFISLFVSLFAGKKIFSQSGDEIFQCFDISCFGLCGDSRLVQLTLDG